MQADPPCAPRQGLPLVVAFAREGLHTAQWQDRAEHYGRFLATCAECHVRFRNEPEG